MVLPQPVVVSKELPRDEKMTFVGLTDGGHYALSEASYPFVTQKALKAVCYSKRIDWQSVTHNERLKALVGTHSAQSQYGYQESHPASLPARSQNDGEKPVTSRSTSPPLPSSPSLGGSKLLGLAVNNPVDLSILVLLFSILFYAVRGNPRRATRFKFSENVTPENITPQRQEDAVSAIIIPGVDVAEKQEPVVEMEQLEPKDPGPTILPTEETVIVTEAQIPIDEPTITGEEIKTREVRFDPKPQEIKDEAETIAPVIPTTPKKKKAHRGQRGGARRRKGNNNPEKEEGDRIDRIVSDAKKVEQEMPLQPDMTDRSSANDVETSLISINGLDVYEDQILGKFYNSMLVNAFTNSH